LKNTKLKQGRLLDNSYLHHSHTQPLVTIGICVKDSEFYIQEVLKSIKEQKFPHQFIEIIIVDDGSKDNTLGYAMSFLSKTDFRYKVFQTEGRGLGLARNIVVKNAKGKYIVWVDGDMTLSKEFIRKQVEFMEQNSNVGIAKGRYGIGNEKSLATTLEGLYRTVEDAKRKGRLVSGFLGTGGCICRVGAIKQVGGFDVYITGAGEDIDVENKVRSFGWHLCLTDAVFYEKFRQTFNELWREYFWFGYGMHFVHHKYKNIIDLYKFLPLSAFLWGVLYSFTAYKLTRKKSAFLLPFYCTFIMTAWCFGYMKGHFNKYAPRLIKNEFKEPKK
jgi:glycosyltransferase involved in cell wall biosynthesis